MPARRAPPRAAMPARVRPGGGGQAGGKDEVLDAEFEEVNKDQDRKG